MTQLPTAYIPTLYSRHSTQPRDGLSTDTFAALVTQLAAADVLSPAASSLMRGHLVAAGLDRAALLVSGDTRLDAVAEWAVRLAASTYTSVLGCASSAIGNSGHIAPSDMPLLTGHGITVASRGVTGEPLIGLPLQELRRELEESRQHLSHVAGYQIRMLLPAPSLLGKAVDGLVLEEARRAGYKLILQPGRSVTEVGVANAPLTVGVQTLQYRIIRTDDSPARLRDWIVGKGLARSLAQVRDLVNRPRRILSRLGFE